MKEIKIIAVIFIIIIIVAVLTFDKSQQKKDIINKGYVFDSSGTNGVFGGVGIDDSYTDADSNFKLFYSTDSLKKNNILKSLQ